MRSSGTFIRRAVLLFTAAFSLIGIAATIPATNVEGATPGDQWSSPTNLGIGAASVVSCASSAFCVAIGVTTGTDTATSFNGKRWGNARTVAQYSGVVTSLSCPSKGWCAAITDLAAVTTLHNGRWSKLVTIDPNPGPPYPGMATALSCTSSKFCLAVDAQGMSETYGGTRWTTPRLVDLDYPLNDVSCGAPDRCVVVDGAGRVLNFDGGRWSKPVVIDTAALTGISCASATSCVAVDLLGRALILRSGKWGVPSPIDKSSAAPLSVSCPLSERCIIADASGRVLLLNGDQWSHAKQVDSSTGIQGSLLAVGCTRGSLGPCVAVDSLGNAIEDKHPFVVKG